VPHLRVKDIQGLLHKDILELELHPDLRDTQELGLHLDNKDTEEHLLPTRDMVELLLKAMVDSNNNNRDMVEQLPHLNRVVDMVEDHLWMPKYSNGSMLWTKTGVARLTPKNSRKPWSMGTGATSVRRPVG